MATFTTNYGWEKPADTDFADNTPYNANFDDIDTEVKALDTRLDTAESDITSIEGRLDDLEDVHFWYATSSGTQTSSSTSQFDLTGLTLDAPVASTSDIFKVTAVVDMQNNNSDSFLAFVHLVVNGVTESKQLVFQPTVSDETRMTMSFTWVVTGIAAGTRTFKLQGAVSNASASFDYRKDHAILTVERMNR